MFTQTIVAVLSASLLGVKVNAAPAATLTERQGGVEVINNCYNSGQVALTFDDGPYIYEYDINNALNGGKGTFFLNGNNYGCIYDYIDTVRFLDSQQHTLASHTWSHKDLTTLNRDEIHDELWRVEQAFIRILGKKPLYFRPPYGAYNDLVLQVLSERGYKKLFLWSDDTGDASGTSVGYQQSVMDGVINSYPSPKMVLQHSTVQSASETILPNSVWQLQQRGYQLVSVDTCLGGAGEWPYEYVGEPGTPDGSWTC